MEKFPFKPIKKNRLYEEVAEQIKEAINSGHLNPGDRLPSERELCKIFNVGRPTIREAIQALSAMGLVEVNVGIKGSIVQRYDINQYMENMRRQLSLLTKVDKKTLKEIWEVRKYIDLGIANATAFNASQNDLKKLDQLIEKMEDASNDLQAYLPLAVKFHKELALATKNKVFFLVWEILDEILIKGYEISITKKQYPYGASKLIEANKAILEAIKSKDPARIAKAIEIHSKENRFLNIKGANL